MDFLSLGSIVKQFSLGVSLSRDALQLSLLSCQWKRVRTVDWQTVAGFGQMPPAERRRQVQNFLKRNGVTHCGVVVSLPRREMLLRELELPLEAQDNLAKVVEYQMVNLLPSEEQAVHYDYLAVREESDPPRLRITLFVILQSTLERYLDLCRDLDLPLAGVLPRAVALANYVRASLPKAATATALVALLDSSGGELVGLVQGQLRLCKEFQFEPPGLAEALENEAERFRGQARLPEETPVELFLAGEGEVPSESGGRLRSRTVPLPGAPAAGPAGKADDEARNCWPAIAAAFCGFKRKGALDVNLLPVEQRAQKPRWEMLPTYGLVWVNALLLLALLLRGPVQHGSYSEELSRERGRLEPAVTAFRTLEAETDHWRSRARLLNRHKHRNQALLAALADLSLILPRDSMVRVFNLKDGVIRIQGTSGQAAALPRILEDSPYFEEAALVSAISRDRQGRETYDIEARLEGLLPPGESPAKAGGAAAPPSTREVNP
jgi:hypothetical protein